MAYSLKTDYADGTALTASNLNSDNTSVQYQLNNVKGHYINLVIENGATPNTQMTVKADALGVQHVALDSTRNVTLASGLTADITLGAVAGGLIAGSRLANTWYEVYVISNDPNSGAPTIAAALAQVGQSITMPAGYTVRRRVGYARTDGSSNFYKQVQHGVRIYYRENTVASPFRIVDADTTLSAWTTAQPNTIVPPGSREAIIIGSPSAVGQLQAREFNQTTQTLSMAGTAASARASWIQPLDSSQRFEWRNTATTGTATIDLVGYIMSNL